MKRTPEIESHICELIGEGCSYAEAARASGIHPDTFRVWRKADPAFSAIVKKAEAEAVAKMIGTITRAATKTWQAAAWWLERKYPNRYAKREPKPIVQHTGYAYEIDPRNPGEWEGEMAVEIVEDLIRYGAPAELVEHAERLKKELIERESQPIDWKAYREKLAASSSEKSLGHASDSSVNRIESAFGQAVDA